MTGKLLNILSQQLLVTTIAWQCTLCHDWGIKNSQGLLREHL